MSRFLGISSTTDTIATFSTVYSITSDYVVNFLPIQKLHLRTNIQFDSYNNYDKSNDILTSIQNNSFILGGNILYNNDTNLTLDEVYNQRPSNIYSAMFNEPSIWQGYQQIDTSKLPLGTKKLS
jgi:hypothetical protein